MIHAFATTLQSINPGNTCVSSYVTCPTRCSLHFNTSRKFLPAKCNAALRTCCRQEVLHRRHWPRRMRFSSGNVVLLKTPPRGFEQYLWGLARFPLRAQCDPAPVETIIGLDRVWVVKELVHNGGLERSRLRGQFQQLFLATL